MNSPTRLTVTAFVCLIGFQSGAFAEPLSAQPTPETYFWEGEHLRSVRLGELDEDRRVAMSLENLRQEADQALQTKPYSVATHGVLPASGNPNDYVSFGTYWWPNPDTEDGLPFVRRDGVSNKEQIAKGDHAQLGGMSRDVAVLSLAGYLFEEPKYSRHAARMLRTWFLDPETRMNPHLKYGQAIPGRVSGRGIGIIDTRRLVLALEGAQVLALSPEWTDRDQAKLKQWVKEYNTWLLTHRYGLDEGEEKNNHGTLYDVQVVYFAMFVGDRDTAKSILRQVMKERLIPQIEPDGRQPKEIARTRGVTYSLFNIVGFCTLARFGEQNGIDLWSAKSKDGRSLQGAIDFILPYLMKPETWPGRQVVELKRPLATSLGYGGAVHLAANRYKRPKYREPTYSESGKIAPEDINALLFAK